MMVKVTLLPLDCHSTVRESHSVIRATMAYDRLSAPNVRRSAAQRSTTKCSAGQVAGLATQAPASKHLRQPGRVHAFAHSGGQLRVSLGCGEGRRRGGRGAWPWSKKRKPKKSPSDADRQRDPEREEPGTRNRTEQSRPAWERARDSQCGKSRWIEPAKWLNEESNSAETKKTR